MKSVSFKMIFRNWRRNKTFALISILSLAVGIACINLLAAFVIHEYNVEAGNPNRERIYMLEYSTPSKPEVKRWAKTDMFAQITSQVPEIGCATQFGSAFATYCLVGEHTFTDFKALKADTGFARIFPQEVIAGNLDEVLRSPGQIAITQSFAQRTFSKDNPMGQPIQVFHDMSFWGPNYKTGLYSYTVGAVLKDHPQGAVPFDLLIMSDDMQVEAIIGAMMLVIPREGVLPSDMLQKINSLPIIDNINGNEPATFEQTAIITACFDTEKGRGIFSKRQTGLLQIALISALFMLITACINYVNLNFSRIVQQLHSIQVQRLMGAGNGGITRQLFADTFTTVLIAFLLSLLIQRDLLPVFNNILSVNMAGSFLYSSQVMPVTLGITLLLAIIPATYISRTLTRLSLSEYKEFYTGKGKQRIITTLAIAQFVIAIGLVTATLSVRQQVSLLEDKIANYTDMYSVGNGNIETPMQPFKERIQNFPGIAALSAGTASFINYQVISAGSQKPGVEYRTYRLISGDEGLIESLNLRQIAGIPWKEAIKTYPNPVFVQETYAKSTYSPNEPYPIGHFMREYDEDFPRGGFKGITVKFDSTMVLAGVVEDYFDATLSSPLEDGFLFYERTGNNYLQVRLHPASATATLNQIQDEWEKLYPGKNLDIESVHAKILERNRQTTRMSDLLMMYSLISIFLTCFGLFGMTLYVTEQRTKEIGIRKVNGSTTGQIMWMFIRQFIVWIGIAFGIAIPVTWYLMSDWLKSFVYRKDMTFGICLLGGLIVIGITLLTVSWHSYRAASGNPVKALRSE